MFIKHQGAQMSLARQCLLLRWSALLLYELLEHSGLIQLVATQLRNFVLEVILVWPLAQPLFRKGLLLLHRGFQMLKTKLYP